MEEDMAPLPVVNRGFGGAMIDDVVRYADRIVVPYIPRPSCSSPAPTIFGGPTGVGRVRCRTFRCVRGQVRLALPRRLSSMLQLRRRERAGVCGQL